MKYKKRYNMPIGYGIKFGLHAVELALSDIKTKLNEKKSEYARKSVNSAESVEELKNKKKRIPEKQEPIQVFLVKRTKIVAIIISIVVAIAVIGISPAFASSLKSYPTHTYTYSITENELTDKTLVKHVAAYWRQYGFHLQYSVKNAQTVITFNKFCNGWTVGTYNTTDHAINLYTNCIIHDRNYALSEQVLAHEFGHFLGFEHYSNQIMTPSIDLRDFHE